MSADLSSKKDFSAFLPPWLAFPQIESTELSAYLKQGATEAWFDGVWRPFWLGLSATEREGYLNFWNATSDWRNAIAFTFDTDETFEIAEDAKESAEYLRQWRASRSKQ